MTKKQDKKIANEDYINGFFAGKQEGIKIGREQAENRNKNCFLSCDLFKQAKKQEQERILKILPLINIRLLDNKIYYEIKGYCGTYCFNNFIDSLKQKIKDKK